MREAFTVDDTTRYPVLYLLDSYLTFPAARYGLGVNRRGS
jgi:hypothetical protein